MAKKETIEKAPVDCIPHLRAIQDTQYVLSGKWKVLIIGSLAFSKKRYMELQRIIEGIGPKMLSKELQDLEINGLVKRTVLASKPITVEYELTPHGHTIQPVIDAMASWGKEHREKVISEIKKK